MTYLVLAVIILYIISLPLVFGVNVDVNTDLNVGKISVTFLIIPVFRKKIDIKRMLNGNGVTPQEKDEDNDKKDEKSDSGGAFKKFIMDCALKILKFVCVKNASLYSKIGTGDAAADGMAVGMLRIMYTQFCAFFGFDGDGIIEPDYDSESVIFDFFGIFSISFADIIIAVLSVITERLVRLGNGKRRRYANVAE